MGYARSRQYFARLIKIPEEIETPQPIDDNAASADKTRNLRVEFICLGYLDYTAPRFKIARRDAD